MHGSFYRILHRAGGIEAVIWTDVVQAIVLWLGGMLAFSIIVIKLPVASGRYLRWE